MGSSFRLGGLAVAVFCLAVAGCNALRMSYTDVKCPSTDVSGQLGTVSRFHGEGGNFANLAYHASLVGAKGTCDIDDDGVTVNMAVTVVAELGPAATDRTADFPYFVAIVGANNRVVFERDFDNPLTFAANRRSASVTDQLSERIPLRDPKSAADYHVFVGFRLNSEELAYNRAHGGT